MSFFFLAIACISLIWGLWRVRINRWPRVQVRVLKTWEEITGTDDGVPTGWLHADLEYWYQSQKYAVRWRGNLTDHPFLPEAAWMVIDPESPDQVHMPARLGPSFVLIMITIIFSLTALRNLVN